MSRRNAVNRSLGDEVLSIESIDAAISKHIEKLHNKLSGQIAQLEAKLEARDATIAKLEDRVVRLENQNDALEQYGRRMNFRVENVPHVVGETSSTLEAQVIGLLQDAGAQIESADVVRLHRSTALRADNRGGDVSTQRSSQVIVKVSRWGARESVHNARNEARAKGTPIKQDLTKARRDLISEANVAIRDWGTLSVPVWCYANINCEPTMRRGREVYRFNTEADLQLALTRFKP